MRRLGFTLGGVLTLGGFALGACGLWSAWDTLGGRPLAYADARRVCLLRAWDETLQRETFDIPLAAFAALAAEAASFEHLAAYRYWSAGLSGEGRHERVQAYRVTADMFPLLGIAPLLGRTLEAKDALPQAPRVAVLSHRFWQRRLAGAPDVLGRELRLDGEPHVIVGVMPARFEFPLDSFQGELWTPLAVDAAAALRDPGSAGSVVAIGRLRAGRSTHAAEGEVRALLARRAAQEPSTLRSLGVRVIPLPQLGSAGAAAGLRLARWAVVAQVDRGALLFQ